MFASLLAWAEDDHHDANDAPENRSSRRLTQIREQRRQVARLRQELYRHRRDVVTPQLDQLRLQRQCVVEVYQSTLLQRQALTQYLDLATRWNVLNDCFHIWHSGPWATINGARLGGDAPRFPAGLLLGGNGDAIHATTSSLESSSQIHGTQPYYNFTDSSQQQQQQQYPPSSAPPPRRNYGLWSSVVAPAPTPVAKSVEGSSSTTANDHTALGGGEPSLSSSYNELSSYATHQQTHSYYSHHSAVQDTHHQQPSKVPWPEVNAALGHVVLLLQLLQDQCGWKNGGMITHELIPMASTSQIGIIRKRVLPAASKSLLATWTTMGSNSSNSSTSEILLLPPVVYHLYFDDSGFAFLKGGALRQFNVALSALLECVLQIQQQQQQQNGINGSSKIILPHAIQWAHHHHHNNNSTNKGQQQHQLLPDVVDITAASTPPLTIGGIPFAYSEGTAVEFTRACKYLLTNIKWLVAHASATTVTVQVPPMKTTTPTVGIQSTTTTTTLSSSRSGGATSATTTGATSTTTSSTSSAPGMVK